jgi:hypothetical protein
MADNNNAASNAPSKRGPAAPRVKKTKDSCGIPQVLEDPPDFDGWAEARKKAWKLGATNPNAFFYHHVMPGHAINNGKWTDEEKRQFLDTIEKFQPSKIGWGVFSTHIRGRVGSQCKSFFQTLLKDSALPVETRELLNRQKREHRPYQRSIKNNNVNSNINNKAVEEDDIFSNDSVHNADGDNNNNNDRNDDDDDNNGNSRHDDDDDASNKKGSNPDNKTALDPNANDNNNNNNSNADGKPKGAGRGRKKSDGQPHDREREREKDVRPLPSTSIRQHPCSLCPCSYVDVYSFGIIQAADSGSRRPCLCGSRSRPACTRGSSTIHCGSGGGHECARSADGEFPIHHGVCQAIRQYV